MAPRVMKEMEVIRQGTVVSLVTLIVSLAISEGVASYMDSNFLGLIFFIVMFGGYLLDSNGRHEWNTVLIFGFIGLWTAITAAANFADTQTKLFTLVTPTLLLDSHQQIHLLLKPLAPKDFA